MDKIIFFTILVIFPFGQLFKFGIFNLFDALVLCLSLSLAFKKISLPSWFKYFVYFLAAMLFAVFTNYQLFEIKNFLYLVRFAAYASIALYVYNNSVKEKILEGYLVVLGTFAGIFGWIQYLFWPDLTVLKFIGWDDHLLRMVGSFLDPTFLGLVMVLTVIIALKNKWYLLVYFLSLSILFTYSRVSFLILLVVFLADLIKNRYVLRFALLSAVFLILFLVPKNIGEGTNLLRTVSGVNKLSNYNESLELFAKSPVYGLGFNNTCSARIKYLNDTNPNSHSCNGSDSSVLFVLSTTGIIGLMLFVSFLLRLPKYYVLNISLLVIMIHSLFSNSAFYPHVMFWFFALSGLKTEVDSKI